MSTMMPEDPSLCGELKRLRDTLREVLSEFILADADRNLWLASGLVDGETMARWRSVAGLGAVGEAGGADGAGEGQNALTGL